MRTLAARPRNQDFYLYPGGGVWTTPFLGDRHEFLDNGARLLDPGAYFFLYATNIAPAMRARRVGAGSRYAVAYTDTQGNPLDGSKTYKMHLPPNVPAKNFGSFTLYDTQKRAMLQPDQRFPAIGNLDSDVEPNAVGYLGPKAPAGQEGNWVQTMPGKGWNAILRLYGPLEPWSTRPGDRAILSCSASWRGNGWSPWQRTGCSGRSAARPSSGLERCGGGSVDTKLFPESIPILGLQSSRFG